MHITSSKESIYLDELEVRQAIAEFVERTAGRKVVGQLRFVESPRRSVIDEQPNFVVYADLEPRADNG